MRYIKTFIFGVRAKGCSLPQPKFKTTIPEQKLTFDNWAKELNVGSRYGYRGSFYQK